MDIQCYGAYNEGLGIRTSAGRIPTDVLGTGLENVSGIWFLRTFCHLGLTGLDICSC